MPDAPLFVDIRPESGRDRDAISAVVTQAFGRDAEARLVDALRRSSAFVPELSLVAVLDDDIVGHILFTQLHVRADDGTRRPGLALAPLAVSPRVQRCGVGQALVGRGLGAARQLGHPFVVVLGHPAYYPRFGFGPAHRFHIRAPFDVRDEAFMALPLQPTGLSDVRGVVEYAPPFAEVG